MKDYIKLLRMKHYIKNLIILFPLLFGGQLLNAAAWKNSLLGMVVFCAASSGVYIINDIHDAPKDRLHPIKKNRPIASGAISKKQAISVAVVCLVIAAVLSVPQITGLNVTGLILLIVYIAINVAYSSGLKDVPILDIVILAAGYVIRVYYGGAVTKIAISDWLFLVITAGALYMGLGKRYGELARGTDTRAVLKSYSRDFLERGMTLMMGLTIVFYALWARDLKKSHMIFSVPVFIIIMLRYAQIGEKKADGDPVEVILSDVPLLILLVIYGIMVSLILYL